MTITDKDGFAFLPKRCDKCNRLFWFEPYWVYYKEVGIEHYSLKQIKCKRHGKRKGGGRVMADYEELVKRLHKRIASTAAGSPLQDDLLEAADAIEELHRENESYANTINEASEILRNRLKSKWISVEERLPEDNIGVLVTDGTDVSEGWLCTCSTKDGTKKVWGLGSNDDGPYDPITHWMPLPKPPAKEEKTENE